MCFRCTEACLAKINLAVDYVERRTSRKNTRHGGYSLPDVALSATSLSSSCGGLEILISNYKSIGLYGTTCFRANLPLSKAHNKRHSIVRLSEYVYMLDVAPRVLMSRFV